MDSTDCGAACLATVARFYGRTVSLANVRNLAGTDKHGTNIYGMVKAAEQLGFSAKAVKGDKASLLTDFPCPAIAHVVVNGNLFHYVVIHKVTQKTIILADPGKGIVKIGMEEFLQTWLGYLILLVPSEKFETGRETKSIFTRFWKLLLPQKKLVLTIFTASVLITLFGILSAFYFQIIIDDILPAGIEKTLIALSIGVLFLKAVSVVLSVMRNHLLLYLSQKLDIDLLLGYYNHVLKLPMNFFGTRKVGEIISRFQDASSIREAISNATLTVMIDTLMAVAGGVILFLKSSTLFLIAFVMVALYAILVFSFNGPYKRANKRQMEDNAQLTSYLVESLNGMQTVKAFNGEHRVQVETETKFVKLLKSIFRLSCIGNAQEGLKHLVEALGGILIIWVGAMNVLNGTMTIGSLVAFNSLLVYFLDPIKNIINLQPSLQTAMAASDRLGEVLDLEIEKNETELQKLSQASLTGDICIRDISFRYGKRQCVLQDFSMDIEAGTKVAIVGESGAGKTTIAKLLLNLYQTESGSITIAGYPIQDIQLDLLRDKIAYIPQETFLFSGTILENLTFGTEDVRIERVIECAKMAQIDDYINELPMRYNTYLEENGSNLSGGQRQRLAIARALLKNPEILIMDEATSHLDSVAEKAIQQTIDSYGAKMTTIIIAHRLSTIRRCDKIFVMEKGRIVEAGTHDELIAIKDGYYSKLYNAQIGES